MSPPSHLCSRNTLVLRVKPELPTAGQPWELLPSMSQLLFGGSFLPGQGFPCWLCQYHKLREKSSAYPVMYNQPRGAGRVRQCPVGPVRDMHSTKGEGCTAPVLLLLQGSQNSLLKQQQGVVSRVQLLSLCTKHSLLPPHFAAPEMQGEFYFLAQLFVKRLNLDNRHMFAEFLT